MSTYKPAGDRINAFQRAGAYIGICCMHIAIWCLNCIGYEKTLVLGEKAGDMLYLLSRRMKYRVMHNLSFALGDTLSANERDHVARGVVRNIARNWFELFFYAGKAKEHVEERIAVEGKENLENALARGKGVIAISAHISNYPILAQQFSRKGFPFVMVIRDPKSRIISAMYTKGRELIELHAIFTTPERQFYKNALKVLNSNGVLCLISDENKRHGGIFVDFFGHPASTPPGPAALALRTGAALVPVFLIRNQDNSQTIIIEKELAWKKTVSPDRDVQEITARFTKIIEHYVRKDLSQWMWTNFRWRTQPWGQSDEAKLKKKKVLKPLKSIFKKLV
jgi:Kdo2-lipid IVA lauroyltransferase/acyltransferase